MTSSCIHIVWFICCMAISIQAQSTNPLSDEFLKQLTDDNLSWRAGRNFPSNANYDVIKTLAGAIAEDNFFSIIPSVTYTLETGKTLPNNFDCRYNWPNCLSLNEIKEQGACASSWAVAAAATMTDRLCIHSNGMDLFQYSQEDLHSCCINHGCTGGGFISLAWQYWQLSGIVSGGNYMSNKGCKPYTLQPCDFDNGCDKIAPDPPCVHQCEPEFNTNYTEAKRRGERIYTITGGEMQIQLEIYKNGPVEALMNVFTDFLSYKSGVYRHVRGERINVHAVKILGWGVESGIKIWTVANSWGKQWGDRGFFKIVRGENHCDIEKTVIAGIPALRSSKRQRIELNLFKKMKLELDWKV